MSSVAALMVLAMAVAPAAKAVIGRANLDGTGVDQAFIETRADTLTEDVAVKSGYVYWTSQRRSASGLQGGAIGRARLDGTGVEPNLIEGVGHGGLAVDAQHLYWVDSDAQTIGRANLDGSGVSQSFVTGTGERPFDVEVDGAHIYWAWTSDTDPPGGSRLGWIGRANTDGTAANPSFMGPFSFGANDSLALDVGHVYWAAGSSVFRANLDGSGAPTCASPVLECVPAFLSYPGRDLAISSPYLYLATFWPGGRDELETGIGRANLSGSVGFSQFIDTDNAWPRGLAVDSSHLYWTGDLADSERPTTVISKGPSKRTKKTKVKFSFTSSVPDATFRCRLDNKPARSCESPTTLRRLKHGRHVFQVRAIDPNGYPDRTAALYRFKVVA